MKTLPVFPLAVVAIALMVSSAVVAQDIERVLHVYDWEFIVTRRPDFPGPDLTRFFPQEEGVEADVEEGFVPVLDPEILLEMIRRNIRPDSWLHEKNTIGVSGGKLTVVQTPDVHGEIARFLAVLRSAQMRMIGLTGIALSVAADHYAASPAPADGLLAPADFSHFLDPQVSGDKVRHVATVSLLAYSSQLVHAGPLNRTRYLRDLAVEVAEQSNGQVPVVDNLLTGTMFSLRPSIVGTDTVLLDVDVAHAEKAGEITPAKTGIGNIDIPVRSLQSMKTTVLVPRGHGALLAATATDGRVLVFIVRPRIVGVKGTAAKSEPKKDGGRELRVYNTRLLTTEIEDKPCSIHETVEIAQVAEKVVLWGADEGVNIEPDTLVEMIKKGIDEDSWSNTRNSIRAAGHLLVVVQKPEVHTKIRAFIDQLRSRRGILVSTNVRVLAVDAERLGELVPAAALAGEPMPSQAVAALDQARQQRKGVRQLHVASLTSFNRQRAHAQTVTERSVIRTAACEIASKSVIYEPVVAALRSGLFVDVRPSLAGDGKHLALDLFSLYTTTTIPKLEAQSNELYFFHKFALRTTDLYTSLLVADGGTMAFLRGPAPGLSTHRLLILVTARSIRVKG